MFPFAEQAFKVCSHVCFVDGNNEKLLKCFKVASCGALKLSYCVQFLPQLVTQFQLGLLSFHKTKTNLTFLRFEQSGLLEIGITIVFNNKKDFQSGRQI